MRQRHQLAASKILVVPMSGLPLWLRSTCY
ncbi:hypothetical protein TELCIR_12916 [Teladorsagia circumcincta]|uniref:Uncharacterized protein n=1 Tax=Teladorsagia circumcincta TaxID=45464 RepID=A0A2G9U565_TELCI|nr:hypothetical protein TELCIR_12916 [Teladorsagia circumcincta]